MFARHITLVAGVVTTLTMDRAYNSVEIVNKDGVAEVHATVGGATPTVDGDDQTYLPAAIGGVEVPAGSNTTVVKLISDGAPRVYVRGV